MIQEVIQIYGKYDLPLSFMIQTTTVPTSIASVIIGVLYLVAAYFVWNSERIGVLIGAGLTLISLVLNIMTASWLLSFPLITDFFFAFIGVVVSIIILVYLFRKRSNLKVHTQLSQSSQTKENLPA